MRQFPALCFPAMEDVIWESCYMLDDETHKLQSFHVLKLELSEGASFSFQVSVCSGIPLASGWGSWLWLVHTLVPEVGRRLQVRVEVKYRPCPCRTNGGSRITHQSRGGRMGWQEEKTSRHRHWHWHFWWGESWWWGHRTNKRTFQRLVHDDKENDVLCFRLPEKSPSHPWKTHDSGNMRPLELDFVCFVWGQVSCSSDWPQHCSATDNDLEFCILLHPPPCKSQDTVPCHHALFIQCWSWNGGLQLSPTNRATTLDS